MKNFITTLLGFLLPLIILAYPLDIYLSSLLKKTNNYEGEIEVTKDIYEGRADCDIAIYGSSRAWVHVSPKILSDSFECTTYNFGMDGHNFWLQYMRYKQLLKHSTTLPKLIIWSVDATSLQKREDLFNLEQFLPFMLWDKDIYKYTSSYKGYEAIDYFVPLIRYAGRPSVLKTCVNSLLGEGTASYREHGYKGIEHEWNMDFEYARKKMERYEVKIDTPSVELCERFIAECKVSKIKLIVVYTPEYILGQEFVKNRPEVIDLYKKLSMKYNIPFLDYSNNSICFQKSFFYNSQHLNKFGSEIFTKILAHDLRDMFGNCLSKCVHTRKSLLQ